MKQFLLYLQNIKKSLIYRYKRFSGKMLSPSSENILMSDEILNIIVEYYKTTYVNYNFWRTFKEKLDNSIIIHVKMS